MTLTCIDEIVGAKWLCRVDDHEPDLFVVFYGIVMVEALRLACNAESM